MASSLEGVLASIPGYGGYAAKRQMNEREDALDAERQNRLIQIATAVQEQQMKARAMQRNDAMTAEIAALPVKNRETVMPILLKYGHVKEAAPMMDKGQPQPIGSGGLRLSDGTVVPPAARPEQPKPQPIGSGGLRMPDGTVVPPAARPESATPQPMQLIYEPKGDGTFRSRDARTGKVVSENALPPGAIVTDPRRKYEGAAATAAGKDDIEQYETAKTASDSLARIDQLLTHLKSSKAITGLGANVLNNVERAKVLLANSEKAGMKVSDTELLDAMLGSEVFPMIKALGIGARGLDTPAEREFLRGVMTGTVTMNKETLVRMTEIRRDITERAVKRWNDRVRTGGLDPFFTATGRTKEEFPGVRPPKPTTPEPTPAQATDGGLTPAEQAELEALRKKHGKR